MKRRVVKMGSTDTVYRDLQKHLDNQAVGFPATESGVEIRLLKEFFSPEEAGVALHLTYRPQSAEDVFKSAKSSGVTLEEVEGMLDVMVGKGAIGIMEKDGVNYYYTMPLLVGMVEWHGNPTPQYFTYLGEYMSGEFGRAYATTKVSQMRTIPVEKSIDVEHHVTTYDHVREIINNTDGQIAVNSCVCREGAKQGGQPCQVTSRTETCMVFGDWASHFIKTGGSRELTKEEALEIMRLNEEDGLVLQPTNYQNVDFVCACCGCCCGILRIHKASPSPALNWAHNYYAVVETESCTGCGTCAERCQVDAITIDEQNGCATVNLERCIGCGNCVVACPSEALRLDKKEVETTPPVDRTSLYELLAEKRS